MRPEKWEAATIGKFCLRVAGDLKGRKHHEYFMQEASFQWIPLRVTIKLRQEKINQLTELRRNVPLIVFWRRFQNVQQVHDVHHRCSAEGSWSERFANMIWRCKHWCVAQKFGNHKYQGWERFLVKIGPNSDFDFVFTRKFGTRDGVFIWEIKIRKNKSSHVQGKNVVIFHH